MTSEYLSMDFSFTSSPSQSPNLPYASNGQLFETASESSNPSSPDQINQIMFNPLPMQYDLLQFDHTGSNFHPMGKIPVEYTASRSSTLDKHDRRRRRTSIISSHDQEPNLNMHLRRRAQNRASQRAFRERKEKHVKGLERQLEDLHERHQDLLQSYTQQADEVTKLNQRISELSTELQTLQTCAADQSFNEMLMPDRFEKFDAFPGPDLLYKGPDYYFDKDAANFNVDRGLDPFEECL